MTTKISDLSIAHRGLWDDDVPENSLRAFKRCVEKRIPIELDVHILKDGNLVVFHDNNLIRMTGMDAKIRKMTLEDVEKLRLLHSEERIPKLTDVLKLVDGKVLLDIELKGDGRGFKICRHFAELMDGYKGEFFVKSFNPLFIMWFRLFRPLYTRGLLASKFKKSKIFKPVKFILANMWLNFLCKPDFIAYKYDDLPNKRIEKLYEKGMPIILWTVRSEKIDSKYDGIIYEEVLNKEDSSKV